MFALVAAVVVVIVATTALARDEAASMNAADDATVGHSDIVTLIASSAAGEA